MVYVGASAVMVQSMLSGSAHLAAFGGPAVITNVLSGGDIIQIAALLPYFTQSVMVRADIRDLRALQGKKIGITRFGSVTDFALRTLVERNNLKDVSTLQMGGFPEAVAALIRGAIDGAVLSPPHTFRLLKEGYRELVSPKDLRALGSGFISQGIVARRSYAVTHRDLVVRLIKATVEATKFTSANEDFTKRLIGKYLGITDAEVLRQSYQLRDREFCQRPIGAGERRAIDGPTHGATEHDRCESRAVDAHQRLLRQLFRQRAQAIRFPRQRLEIALRQQPRGFFSSTSLDAQPRFLLVKKSAILETASVIPPKAGIHDSLMKRLVENPPMKQRLDAGLRRHDRS